MASKLKLKTRSHEAAFSELSTLLWEDPTKSERIKMKRAAAYTHREFVGRKRRARLWKLERAQREKSAAASNPEPVFLGRIHGHEEVWDKGTHLECKCGDFGNASGLAAQQPCGLTDD